jgi:hypothetical protein
MSAKGTAKNKNNLSPSELLKVQTARQKIAAAATIANKFPLVTTPNSSGQSTYIGV